ncbi:FKBP-type peptidyl-prolyl cis-trans isomerase [Microbacterium suaedae]|uniref:FKBP-type peptidyl-prolyl cis-trans isomerase n=1 Tax=Microbacterium suaedae TaxID=2067813 RepID=UPI000DA1DF47|nr:FKBP-type peptidyl-prolyl cis-trans isomerase [Microbacterium suaedae]
MRKTTAVASVLGLTTLALAGCSSAPQTAEQCGREAVSDPVMNAVEVSGEFGTEPVVELPASFVTDDAEHADAIVGDGPVIDSASQGVVFDATLFDGGSGTEIPITAYAGDPTQVIGLSNIYAQIPGLEDALQCATEGSRVVASLGADGIAETYAQQIVQFASQYGLDVDPTNMVAVVDLQRVLPAAADGQPVYNDGFGLPSVVRAPGGEPGVIVPDGAAPDEQVTQTLLAGDGAELAEGDTVTVQYTSVSWSAKAVSTSTWQTGQPTTSTVDQLPEGFADALEGATIGSQVLTVVPGDGDATVSVIDVLGAVPAA